MDFGLLSFEEVPSRKLQANTMEDTKNIKNQKKKLTAGKKVMILIAINELQINPISYILPIFPLP